MNSVEEKKRKLNKGIYEEVRNQLEPLFSGFYPTSPQYRAYFEARKQIEKRLDRINSVMKSLVESSPLLTTLAPTIPLRFACILRAISYLFYIELFGNFYVNLALLLLVGKGQALHLEPDREHRYVRHATSLEDIESPTLSLSVKLDFLESNKLPFFRKWINTKLRNKIAHADFDIDDRGDFFLVDAKGHRKKVDVMQEMKSFTEYHNAVAVAFMEYLFGKK